MPNILWIVAALASAAGWGAIALHRGETISAAWLLLAAIGSYLIAWRFYSRFLAARAALAAKPKAASRARKAKP